MNRFQLCVKRIIDIWGSFVGIVILSPIFLLIAIMIYIIMPGPIFFMQRRVGKDGKVFRVFKFRSMKVNKAAEETFDTTMDEARLTSFGRLIRRVKIDELPQLLNVLLGDMSLVGPRPALQMDIDGFSQAQKKRLDMKPGMTGLAQVSGNITLSWDERVKYDLYYIHNHSLWLDAKIILRTILIIIFGEEKFTRRFDADNIVLFRSRK